MRYLLTHLDTAWALTLIHLRLALVPLLLGLLIDGAKRIKADEQERARLLAIGTEAFADDAE